MESKHHKYFVNVESHSTLFFKLWQLLHHTFSSFLFKFTQSMFSLEQPKMYMSPIYSLKKNHEISPWDLDIVLFSTEIFNNFSLVNNTSTKTNILGKIIHQKVSYSLFLFTIHNRFPQKHHPI